MSGLVIVVGLGLAVVILSAAGKVPRLHRSAAAAAALLVLGAAIVFSSVRHVGESEVGLVVKHAMGPKLPPGQIIATGGEMGPQAKVLPPGWHFGYWPIVYDVDKDRVIEINEGKVGLLTTTDGLALPPGEIYAPEWPQETLQAMLIAEHFLGPGRGYKGPQASVLTPGKYRLNTRLYQVEIVPVTNIEKATVGVVKSNVGKAPASVPQGGASRLVEAGSRGIWRVPYTEQKLYLHTRAYEVTHISLMRHVVRYATSGSEKDESEIMVRSSDGFTFPVDVRIEYEIVPQDAPVVVAMLGDDREKLRDVLTSAVRAIFRNNAEGVKALDYVQQRSHQESQSLSMLREELAKLGVTVKAVRIGNVGDERSLGSLLKTQTDREIALQEQETFREQQRAAEEKKALTRTQQESEEERRLATAKYQVQIAEQDKERRIIEAGAEAQAIRIRAEAQAEAYRIVAQQIGPTNAALVELLKIVGERGINITPRVMVVGGTNGATQPTDTTALIGTMLDTMLSKEDVPASGVKP